MTKISTIILDNDVIEILHNQHLSKNPYLIRLTNYDGERYSIRANHKDLEQLSDIIDKALGESKSNENV